MGVAAGAVVDVVTVACELVSATADVVAVRSVNTCRVYIIMNTINLMAQHILVLTLCKTSYLQSLNIVLGLQNFPICGLQSVNLFAQGLMDDVGPFVLFI